MPQFLLLSRGKSGIVTMLGGVGLRFNFLDGDMFDRVSDKRSSED